VVGGRIAFEESRVVGNRSQALARGPAWLVNNKANLAERTRTVDHAELPDT